MRGTPGRHGPHRVQTGIIPAYAGNTADHAHDARHHGDHPRVCGEHTGGTYSWRRSLGSSPRMRGTRLDGYRANTGIGIIPAYAGNTSVPSPIVRDWRDHPRVCGEHVSSSPQRRIPPGSSPRMRGTPRGECDRCHFRGIIPAYAGNTSTCTSRGVMRGDHPRACGEHPFRRCKSVTLTGSSPRMRGTQKRRGMLRRQDGIIPAYAGNTSTRTPSETVTRDHPRVCGEHPTPAQLTPVNAGSSPRMRGTHGRCRWCCEHSGIIPAYAGNTHTLYRYGMGDRDHPRVCGEHPCCRWRGDMGWGSSPRMRGTLIPSRLISGEIGIIPAYAGNTAIASATSLLVRDHPRVCGEHVSAMSLAVRLTGSSPRMRGTLRLPAVAVFDHGIIPAYAGNTRCCWPSCWCCRDHPRVCGEHMLRERRIVWQAGSSPRMRGTPFGRRLHFRPPGIIPAYAGNTVVRVRRLPLLGDHPRVCGEHVRLARARVPVQGSSPRMRGTPEWLDGEAWADGIIPAYAGNTCGCRERRQGAGDHPRVCGEHIGKKSEVRSDRGSSPRMRGTPGQADKRMDARGIIPAYAGNTLTRQTWANP